jgi:hypothetical protein
MSWFKAHLNVTSALTYIPALFAYDYSYYLNHRPGAYFEAVPWYVGIIQIVVWSTFIVVNAWVLKQKGQNLVLVLGAGAFIPILLPNKRRSQPLLADDVASYIEKNSTDRRLRFKIFRLPWYLWIPLSLICFIVAMLIPFVVFSRFDFGSDSIYYYLLTTCCLLLAFLGIACFNMAWIIPSNEKKDGQS